MSEREEAVKEYVDRLFAGEITIEDFIWYLVDRMQPKFQEVLEDLNSGVAKTKDYLTNIQFDEFKYDVLCAVLGEERTRIDKFSRGYPGRTKRERVANCLFEKVKEVKPGEVKWSTVRRSLYRTEEGKMRIYVGARVEDQITKSIENEGISYTRGKKPPGLITSKSVDICIPNEANPRIILEVKGRTVRHGGHAYLYSRDLAFSAINLKAKYPNLVMISITIGYWQETAQKVIEKLFDYHYHYGWEKIEDFIKSIPALINLIKSYLESQKLPPKRVQLHLRTANKP